MPPYGLPEVKILKKVAISIDGLMKSMSEFSTVLIIFSLTTTVINYTKVIQFVQKKNRLIVKSYSECYKRCLFR